MKQLSTLDNISKNRYNSYHVLKNEGGGKMGMIFKISGNYVQDGSWAVPDPAFEGEVLIDDNDVLCGYAIDLANSDAHSVIYREKYLVGSFGITCRSDYGVAFYKFSGHPYYATKMYLLNDIGNPDSATWAEQNEKGLFLLQGAARVHFQRMPYSDTMANEIRTHFERLSDLGYGQMQETIKTCTKAVVAAC